MRRRHIAEFDYDRHEIERALFFLSNALQDSGHNEKPVLLHTIQVAEMLWENGMPQNTVIAGILHDVVEDTEVTIEDIERGFGGQVALYVEALTVSDTQDIMLSIDRSAELGDEVLSIRAADMIQNSYYYHLAMTDMQKHLHDKYTYLMDVSRDLLDKHFIDELNKAYENNVKTLLD